MYHCKQGQIYVSTLHDQGWRFSISWTLCKTFTPSKQVRRCPQVRQCAITSSFPSICLKWEQIPAICFQPKLLFSSGVCAAMEVFMVFGCCLFDWCVCVCVLVHGLRSTNGTQDHTLGSVAYWHSCYHTGMIWFQGWWMYPRELHQQTHTHTLLYTHKKRVQAHVTCVFFTLHVIKCCSDAAWCWLWWREGGASLPFVFVWPHSQCVCAYPRFLTITFFFDQQLRRLSLELPQPTFFSFCTACFFSTFLLSFFFFFFGNPE